MEPTTQPSLKWYDKTWVVVLWCLFFFPVGLYALWKNSFISKGWKIAVTILIALIVLAQIGKDKKNQTVSAPEAPTNTQAEVKQEEPKGVGIGQILHTEYFDVTVNKVNLQDRVNTGNEFADLKPEQDNMYLIINATFKNTDKESRMLTDGKVWINYQGKEYEFDKSETVMLEGWGLLLDQINPLTKKTTNLIYKVPAEIKGPAYWQPGRASNDQKILLGNL